MQKQLLIILSLMVSVTFAEEGYVPESNQSNEAVAIDANYQANTEGSANVILNKIRQLESDVQKLRGTLEEQANEIRILKQSGQNVLKSTQTQNNAVGVPGAQIPSVGVGASALASGAATSEQQALAKADYNKAFDLITDKRFDDAIVSFKVFLKNHPNSTYVANSYYWLGELYLATHKPADAILSFTTVVNDFPKSSKVPGAKLKLGMSFMQLEQWSSAKKEFNELIVAFPESPSAKLAQTKLKALPQNLP